MQYLASHWVGVLVITFVLFVIAGLLQVGNIFDVWKGRGLSKPKVAFTVIFAFLGSLSFVFAVVGLIVAIKHN